MNYYTNLIKNLREECNLTQEELAFELGVAKITLGKWERGETNPDENSIKKIEQLYDKVVKEGRVKSYYGKLFFKEKTLEQKFLDTFELGMIKHGRALNLLERFALKMSFLVLNALYEDLFTYEHLILLLVNSEDKGKGVLAGLKYRIREGCVTDKFQIAEIEEAIIWFINDYYTGMIGGRGPTKTYENLADLRYLVYELKDGN